MNRFHPAESAKHDCPVELFVVNQLDGVVFFNNVLKEIVYV